MGTEISNGKAKGKESGFVQLITFVINNEEFGVDILKVKEINLLIPVTVVPRCPKFVEGVINLRGNIIPIINLRTRLNLPPKANDDATRIVIVEIGTQMVGFIVDGVTGVTSLHSSAIEPPPSFVAGIGAEYLQGVGKIDNRLIILINLERTLSAIEKIDLKEVKQ